LKNKDAKSQQEHLEYQHRKDIVPGGRDGLSKDEAEYIAERFFVFSLCEGNLTEFEKYWNENNFLELFEKYIFLNVNY
jgi:ketosteroid isomerase-like protein